MTRKVRNKEHLQASLSFLGDENLGYRLPNYDIVKIVSAEPAASIFKRHTKLGAVSMLIGLRWFMTQLNQ
jgi:hypothetical protein